MSCSTINALITLLNISLKVLYFDNISLLLAIFTGNTSEHPFCLQIKAFVLDSNKDIYVGSSLVCWRSLVECHYYSERNKRWKPKTKKNLQCYYPSLIHGGLIWPSF